MTDNNSKLTVAIDFGTTNTVGVGRSGTESRIITVDGAPRMPSAVLLTVAGDLVVGQDATRMARAAPRRFERHPKSRIDEGELLFGDTTLTVSDAVRAVLRKMLDEATRQFGTEPDQLVLTHPADWGSVRLGTLTNASNGLAARTVLVPEPVAAGAWYGMRAGSSLVVLDYGGGTCDAAAVHHETSGGYRVLSCAGLPNLGGNDLDQRVIDYALAHRPMLARMVAGHDSEGARERFLLQQDARAAKELLSRHPRAEITTPGVESVGIERTEFEELIGADIDRVVWLLDDVRRAARVDRAESVYMVGGSSRLRLLHARIAEHAGLNVYPAEEPEVCVAWGALMLTGSAERVVRNVPGTAATESDRPAPSGAKGAAYRPVAAAPRPRVSGARAGIALGVAAVVVAVVVAIVVTDRGVAGTALPEQPSTATSSAPRSSTMPAAKPGNSVTAAGEPAWNLVDDGETGRYLADADEIPLEVDLQDANVSDRSAPDGYRWVHTEAVVKRLKKHADKEFTSSVKFFIGLLDDRQQYLKAPPGKAEDCPHDDETDTDDSLEAGESTVACNDFLISDATPIAAVVFGNSPVVWDADEEPLRWDVDIPADGKPASMPEPVAELNGRPTEVSWVDDFLTLQLDLVAEPSAYLVDEPDLQPGSRLLVLRVLTSATGSGDVADGLFEYFALVDDRGMPLLDAWDEFFEPAECPGPKNVPVGETELVCTGYVVDADTPIAGVALMLDETEPDEWKWWPAVTN